MNSHLTPISPAQHAENLQVLREYPVNTCVCMMLGPGSYRYGTVHGYVRVGPSVLLRVKWVNDAESLSEEHTTRVRPHGLGRDTFFPVA